MLIAAQVGPIATTASLTPGTSPNLRLSNMGDLVVSELHGRFYEQAYRQTGFRIGTTAAVTLTANHGTTNGGSATLATAAAATPMLGLWNPSTSGFNAVLQQAQLQAWYNTVTTPTATGSFIWYVGTAQGAITTGLTPFNSKTLAQSGSVMKAFAGATALTGLGNILTALEAADLSNAGSVTYGTIGNTAITPSIGGVQNFDGQLIVPPGGVLALYNTGNGTSFNYTGRLFWEEVPV